MRVCFCSVIWGLFSKVAHLYSCTGCDHYVLQRVGKLHSNAPPLTAPAAPLAPVISTAPATPTTAPAASADSAAETTPSSATPAAMAAPKGNPKGFKYSAGTGPVAPSQCPHCQRVYQVAPAASFTLLIFCSTFFLFVCLFL